MARIIEQGSSLIVKLSAADTYTWAHRTGASWPGSQLSGRSVVAEFDRNGDLLDYRIDGKYVEGMDVTEFNACTSDHIEAKFPNHPAIR